MFILWIKFIIAAAVVVYCGYRICVYAEKIARAIKISRGFAGLILLAVVTSLPELAVAISATKLGALDLAVGDLFGSNLFNLTIVGIIFLKFVKNPRVLSLKNTHFISLAFSVLLIALAAVGIIFSLGVETALILVVYIFGAHLILRNEKAVRTNLALNASTGGRSVSETWIKFVIYSAALVGFAIYLAYLGDEIARIPVAGVALGGTFVGSLFVAVTTSLPETAVAISAARLGFFDMALGNIFGSNMFNMLIVAVSDLSLGRKTLLSCVSAQHLFTILFVIISSALVCAGLAFRSRRKTPALAWDSAAILFVYFAANLVNFYLR